MVSVGRAGRPGDRAGPVRDHPPDAPAKPGIAAAAEGAEAAARHRAQQHDAGAGAVRRVGAARAVQSALHRHVRTVDRHRQTRARTLATSCIIAWRSDHSRATPTNSTTAPSAASPMARSPTTIASSTDGRWFQIVNQPLAQGGWVATIEEITEQRRLEQERDRNQAFLREIIDHIPSQITVKDVRERRYVLVNRVAETHFGLPRDDILGKTAPEMFPKASAEIIAADDETTLQSPDGLFKDEHVWEQPGAWASASSPRGASPSATRMAQRALPDQHRRRRHRTPPRPRPDHASRALRSADRPAEPGAVLRADRARTAKGQPRRTIRPALYRRRRIQGHQRLARTPCRRRAPEGGGRPPARLHPRDRPDRAPRRRRIRRDPDRGQATSTTCSNS